LIRAGGLAPHLATDGLLRDSGSDSRFLPDYGFRSADSGFGSAPDCDSGFDFRSADSGSDFVPDSGFDFVPDSGFDSGSRFVRCVRP